MKTEALIQNPLELDSLLAASRALVTAARRVDASMTQTNPSNQVVTAWNAVRQQLRGIVSDYR